MATTARENHREDVAGRANVEDTPELLAYYDELEQLDAGALWTVANKIEPWQPKSASVPVLWRYRDLREHVLRSVELVTPEKAGRRVIYLNNPGRRDVAAAVGWLYSGLQVMHPGEVASAHAHSASALRFIMEGTGAYTIVDGHKMTLGANDFVLTPNGTWHEHGVDSRRHAVHLAGRPRHSAGQRARGELLRRPSRPAARRRLSGRRHRPRPGATRVCVPRAATWRKAYSPLFKYEWEPTYEALQRYAKATDGSPYDGVLMNYVNPVTGGPVMQTIGASMQMLRPGERTKAHRHTGSFIYQVAKGSGLFDHRRPALRLAGARHLLRARPGRGTSTPTRPRATTPACSPSTTCR